MNPTKMLHRVRPIWFVAPVTALLLSGCAARHYRPVSCEQSRQSVFILEAQAVPSATLIPCMGTLPQGWSYGGSDIRSGLARFWFHSDRAGPHAIEVSMTRGCDVSGATEVPLNAPPPGLHRYESVASINSHASLTYFVFPGGCVTYRFTFSKRDAPILYAEADRALGFTSRALYVTSIRQKSRLNLCGAGAPACRG